MLRNWLTLTLQDLLQARNSRKMRQSARIQNSRQSETETLESRAMLSAAPYHTTFFDEVAAGAIIERTTVSSYDHGDDNSSAGGSGGSSGGNGSGSGDAFSGGGDQFNGNGLEFNFNAAGGMSQQAIDGFQAAADLWSSILTDDIIINIDIDFRVLAAGILGQASSQTQATAYADYRNALIADSLSASDEIAVANLPAGPNLSIYTSAAGDASDRLDNDGSNNNRFLSLNRTTAKAVGLRPANDGATDASITFSSLFTWDFDRSNGITPGSFDFVGVAAHEIGHALGFRSGVDAVDGTAGTGTSLDNFAIATGVDVFRFSAQSVANGADIDMQAGTETKFFSIDGGVTQLTTFSQGRNQGDGQQASHWKDNLNIGIMDPTAAPGEYADITELDVQAMDVTGWDINHDFGDAPDTTSGTGTADYQTTLDNNGPRHDLFAASGNIADPSGAPKVFLGNGTSRDFAAQPNASATGDFDDGVTIPQLVADTTVQATVVSTGGELDYFVDFNMDGDFADAGESFSATVTNGTSMVDIAVPAGTLNGTAVARFRLSTAGGLGPSGPAADGEVEDYLVNLAKAPTELYLNEILVDPDSAGGDNPDEYIELRGIPGTPLDDIYLVFLESDSGGSLGSINNGTTNVVPLAGHTVGSNGYVVIVDDLDDPYSIAAGTTVIDVANLDVENASWTAMLIEVVAGSDVPSDQDLDVDDNGLDSLPAGWNILDSIAVLDGGVTDRGYSSVVFSANGSGNSEAGGTIVDVGVPADNIHHVMRVGDSTGQTAADWVAFEHNAIDSTAPDWKILTSSSASYFSRNVITNHLGESNPTEATSIEPEINVQHQDVDIADGDQTPSTVEGTDFGYVLTTGGSKTRTFTIENSGAGPLSVTDIVLTGTHAQDFAVSNFTPGIVAVNATLTFDITFDPLVTGSSAATVEIHNDDADESVYRFDIAGQATDVLAPEIEVSGSLVILDGDTTPDHADSTDFGSVIVNNGSAVQTYTIRNVGSSDLDVSAITITGANSTDFTVSGFTAGSVAVDASITFIVTFDPSADGLRTATVNIANDDADENPYDFAIAGFGVTKSVLESLVFNEILPDPNSATRNFDTDGDGTAEASDQFFELYNTSSVSLDVGGLQFWDSTGRQYLTIEAGTILGPNGHLVIVKSIDGGSLPTVPAGSHAFETGGTWTLLEDGDNLVAYDPLTDEYLQAIFNGAATVDPTADYPGFSTSATRIRAVLDFGSDTDGTSRALSPDGDTSSILDHDAIGNTAIVATPGNPNVAPGKASDNIVISEIMYNPASRDNDWEWIELTNLGPLDVSIGGWVIDDIDVNNDNSQPHSEPNIVSGIIPAFSTAVLYNGDALTADDFQMAWGFGINTIPVTNWSEMRLTSFEQISLWEQFSNYEFDPAHRGADITQFYTDDFPWPEDDGYASIYLTDLAADATNGANWALSTVGIATPAGGPGYTSRSGGSSNSGEDIGSPGGAFPGLTVEINSDSIMENAGNAATTVTITRTGDLSADLSVTLLSDDTTEADLQSTVVIPAGEPAVSVNLNAIDDALIDGTQLVTITASAAGLDDGSDTINVVDNDSNALVVSIADSSVAEAAGADATTVTISRVGSVGDVTVNLQSSDTTEATVPATAVIPDGQTSVTVNLDAIDDDFLDGNQTVTITVTATGFTSGSADVVVTDDEFLATDFLLNEIMFNPTGADTGNEYIELRGTPNGFLPDDAYILLIEGDASNQGVLEQRFDIGGWRFGANGFLVLLQAGNTFTTDPDSAVFTANSSGWGTDFSSRTSDIENGSVTVLLVQNANEPAVAVDYDTDDDGSLDGAAAAWRIVDGYGNLDGGSNDTAYGLINTTTNGSGLATSGSTVVTLDGFLNGYAGRIGDSTTATTADWVFGEVAGSSPNYVLATDNVAPAFLGEAPMDHIGATNAWTPPTTLEVTIDLVEISENGGSSTATLRRTTGDISGDLIVTLSSDDTTEATVPPTVTIPAGSDSVTFGITAVDDAIADGTQTATITASATGFTDGTDTIDILDDDSSGFAILESDSTTVVTEGGSTDTFTVVLNSQPTSDVVLTIVAGDLTEATAVPATLTFTSIDWETPQTVTVTGVDDVEDDGDQISTITISVDDAASDDAFDNLADQTVSVTTIDDDESFSVIITEIMFNPASTEDDWEWIELYNTTDTAIDLAGWVVDDNNTTAHSAANIAAGVLAANSTAVLFNADDVALVDFQAAWGVGINLIPVTNWSGMGLGNVGDTIGLWDSFASYDGDNVDQTATVFGLTYDDTNPWPSDDGFGSIFLTDLAADPTAGINWALSTDGVSTPAGGAAYTSRMVGGNSGSDIGSPGGSYVGLTVAIDADAVDEDAGNAATTVTITRSGDVSAPLMVALNSDDITEAKIVGSVLIPAGQASVTVDLEAVDDALVDGNQVATITATAPGLDDGSDTVVVIDNDAPTLTIIIDSNSMSENGGSSTATLFRNTDTANELVVNIASDDTSEAVVPVTVTIPAGSESVTFSIDAVDDAIVDGTQTTSITATAAGFFDGIDSIDVTDDDVATISINITPDSISENGGTATGTVSRNTNTAADLVVTLINSDLTEADVPATVVIPAGQVSVDFTIDAVDDDIVDGTQTVTINGAATDHVAGSDNLNVTDDDVATLTLSLDEDVISENGGTAFGTITRNTDSANELVVTLTIDDPSEASVPATVTIPAGSAVVTFPLNAVDDSIVDGTQTATISATVTGYLDGVDSIDVTDDDVAELTLSISPVSINENGGTATGTVTRNTDTSTELIVSLNSNDTSEADVPTTVTIPAGQASATFPIVAVDDAIVDGTQTVTILATATGFVDANDSIDVTDDDIPGFTVTIAPTTISENGGSATGTVTRNTDTTAALVVSLTSNDTTEATVPATVTIPAGQASVSFTIDAADDAIVDGTQTATITAGAAGFGDGAATVDVTDDDVASLTVVIDLDSINENGGQATGTVTRNADLANVVVVTLLNDDATEASVPATVTIPAGQLSVDFTIDAVDDASVDGTQTVTITAQATGFADSSDTIDVTDDDVATLVLAINPDVISENGGLATATISRNTNTTSELVVTLSNSDTTEASVPATVTIPAGATSTTFLVSGVDDAIVDGTQTATITGTAAGFINGSDLVDVTDDDGATLVLTIDADSISENSGSTTATITRNTDTTAELVVTLSNSDVSEASVPATVTIAAGAATATFTIDAVDDAIVDGTQTAAITATATGFASGSDSVDVTDDDIATLIVTIDADSISENGGSTTATITRNTDTTAELIVNLSNSDTSEANIPTTVAIPAGATSATFGIDGVDDSIADGTQTATITGTATGFVDGSDSIDVTDDDVATLTLTIAADSISENGGATTATVTRNTDTTVDLVVTLTSSDTSEASVPATVTIPAGAASVSFAINAVDDDLVDGTQTATISATATGLSAATDLLDITDDDVAAFVVTETDGGTIVSETGTTDTFNVVLSSAPVTPVTLIVSESDLTEATASPVSLVFDSTNWAIPQTVTVLGIDDSILDGSQTSTVTISVDDSASDDAFDSVANQQVSVQTLDDEQVIASITRIEHAEENQQTSGIFRISLTEAPLAAADITYIVSGTAINGVDYSTLSGTITVGAGQTSIDLPVNVIDDDFDETSETVIVSLTGGDVEVDAAASTTSLLIIDNDVSSILVDRTALSLSEDGTSETFNVTLSSQPDGNVIVLLTATDSSEVSLSTSTLTFTPANWNVGQLVTATGVDDALVDGDIASSIVLTTDGSSAGNFSTSAEVSIAVTTADNDSAALATINSVTFFNRDAEAERNLSLDNTGQRSMVRRVEVILDGVASINSAAGFTAVNRVTSANVSLAFVSSTMVNNQTIVVLQFTSQLDPATRPDASATPASLLDGLYRLSIDGAASGIDVTGSGTASGSVHYDFHRLFGDGDGDRDVDGRDFGLYRQALGGSNPLDAVFDFDNDGQLFRDLDDLMAFRSRYGRRI